MDYVPCSSVLFNWIVTLSSQSMDGVLPFVCPTLFKLPIDPGGSSLFVHFHASHWLCTVHSADNDTQCCWKLKLLPFLKFRIAPSLHYLLKLRVDSFFTDISDLTFLLFSRFSTLKNLTMGDRNALWWVYDEAIAVQLWNVKNLSMAVLSQRNPFLPSFSVPVSWR